MNRILSLKIVQICVCLLWVSMLFSCGASRKSTISSNKTSLSEWKDPLSAEERRKFNHFFLEAVRLKEKGEMDAAFEMYSHCLAIDSQSAATLYELGKFYMYLGQPTKGENFLRKAMQTQPLQYGFESRVSHCKQRDSSLLLPNRLSNNEIHLPSRHPCLRRVIKKGRSLHENGLYI